MYEHSELLHI